MNSLLNRRDLAALLFTSLAVTLQKQQAVARALQGPLDDWVKELDSLARALAAGQTSALSSQQKLGMLLNRIDLNDLTAAIDFDRLIDDLPFPERGEKDVVFEMKPGLRVKTEITALNRGRSIPPHAHNNQMTAHLVLRGELHARHFDREDDGEYTILTRTLDHMIHRGDFSMMSDAKDNVHWFTAQREPAYLFNVVVSDLATRPGHRVGRHKLDLRGGEMSDGRIRAKGIGQEEWLAVYG